MLGHEVSHVANGDMVTMTLLTGIANTFVMFFSRIVASLVDSFLRDDDGNGTLARYRKKSFGWYRDVIASNGARLVPVAQEPPHG